FRDGCSNRPGVASTWASSTSWYAGCAPPDRRSAPCSSDGRSIAISIDSFNRSVLHEDGVRAIRRMKALIKVGYACNDHCTFCHTYDVRHIDDTADRVAQKICRAAALGHSMVVFSGGEPTIRRELFSW